MQAQQLIVFVKNAEPGRVKTRLAATIGNKKALEIYHGLLAYTIAQTQELTISKKVFYSPSIIKDDQWAKAGFDQALQSFGQLGNRMSDAFKQAFQDGYRSAAIIGSDCPELTTKILNQAFEALETHDVVMGPAEDGGYYLLGMSSFQPELFQHKQWSSNSVGPDTQADCLRLGLSLALLPTLSDIDYEEDWVKHKGRVLPFM